METKIVLVILCLLVATHSLSVVKTDRHMAYGQNKVLKHTQAVDPVNTAVEKATEETVKYILQNPYEAAKIPTKLIKGKIDGLIQLFEGQWNIKNRARSLQLTFVNTLKKEVNFLGDYFDSGVWCQNWQAAIPGMSIQQGEVANRQGSWFAGVTGGFKLQIQGENTFIYLGFNNPYAGGYKNFIEITSNNNNPRYGYDKSVNNSPKLSNFKNYRLRVVQTQSQICQMAFVYTLQQV